MAPNYATFYHRSSFPEQSRYFVELQHKNKQGMNALAFEKKNILIILLTYSKKDESFDKSLHIKKTHIIVTLKKVLIKVAHYNLN